MGIFYKLKNDPNIPDAIYVREPTALLRFIKWVRRGFKNEKPVTIQMPVFQKEYKPDVEIYMNNIVTAIRDFNGGKNDTGSKQRPVW